MSHLSVRVLFAVATLALLLKDASSLSRSSAPFLRCMRPPDEEEEEDDEAAVAGAAVGRAEKVGAEERG